MPILTLEKLKEAIQLFSPTQCDFLSENCIVAFENNNHTPGCVLKGSGDKNADFQLDWSKKINVSGYKEDTKIIEHAAEGVAFLLTPQLTEFTVIEEALIGTGFDYWLGYDETHSLYDPKNFLRARLEISGIKTETPFNTVQKRVKEKKKQTAPSDDMKLPAYISVTEFSAPKSYFGIK